MSSEKRHNKWYKGPGTGAAKRELLTIKGAIFSRLLFASLSGSVPAC